MEVSFKNIKINVVESLHPTFWKTAEASNWESATFDVLNQYVNEGDTVLDIGCWIGPISLYLANKKAIVYSFEPDPKAFKAFKENIRLNPKHEPYIYPQNFAVVNKTGQFNIYARTGFGNSSSSLLHRTRDQVNAENIKGISLRDFIKNKSIDKITLIKVDIEGGEYAIAKQLSVLKEEGRYDSLILSMHYNHLNEYIYRKTFSWNFFCLVMMRIERSVGFYFFKKKILKQLKSIYELSKLFGYTYDLNDKTLINEEVSPNHLLSNQADLFLTDSPWNDAIEV